MDKCKVCGASTRNMYCSGACRQKAYRDRFSAKIVELRASNVTKRKPGRALTLEEFVGAINAYLVEPAQRLKGQPMEVVLGLVYARDGDVTFDEREKLFAVNGRIPKIV